MLRTCTRIALVAGCLGVAGNPAMARGPTVLLPVGIDPLAWSAAAGMLDLSPVGSGDADVVIWPGTTSWRIRVLGTDGKYREALASPPATQADREAMLILALSLRQPLGLGTLPALTPAALPAPVESNLARSPALARATGPVVTARPVAQSPAVTSGVPAAPPARVEVPPDVGVPSQVEPPPVVTASPTPPVPVEPQPPHRR